MIRQFNLSAPEITDQEPRKRDTVAAKHPWLLIFDLDGTLIDSSLDLCHTVNATLRHVHRSPLEHEQITAFVGDGAATLVRRALHAAGSPGVGFGREEDTLFESAFPFFLEYYRNHKLDNTFVYPGVLDALDRMRQRSPEVLMAVLTNKPSRPSREICNALGLAPFFFANYGGDSFATKKPAPEGLEQILLEAELLRKQQNSPVLGSSRMDVVMIGDSAVDVLVARATGILSLGCRYGLSPESLDLTPPDLSVESASEWPEVLGF